MQSLVSSQWIQALQHATEILNQQFNLPPFQADSWDEKASGILNELAQKLGDNYPYFHPQYAGQMLKPPHPLAQAAYALAMSINPNNHALDGGKATSALEKIAVADLARMVGFTSHLGHLTSGGTFANLEALWMGKNLHPNKKIMASQWAHYTHQRICGVLGISFETWTGAPKFNQLWDLTRLEERFAQGDIGTFVVTLGTTGAGIVEPLHDILPIARRHNVRIHVDAAYGGYFGLSSTLKSEVERAYRALPEVDSLVIDPHKHGLLPYGCGAILFKDPSLGTWYAHDSPYTYFTSDELHLGEISLECSRAGASAAALWAIMQYFPLEKNGTFGQRLDQSMQAANQLYNYVLNSKAWLPVIDPDLDIVLLAPQGKTVQAISEKSKRIFKMAEAHHWYLALYQVPVEALPTEWNQVAIDAPYVTCLRLCLMKPQHVTWIPKLQASLDVWVQDEVKE